MHLLTGILVYNDFMSNLTKIYIFIFTLLSKSTELTCELLIMPKIGVNIHNKHREIVVSNIFQIIILSNKDQIFSTHLLI